MVVSTYAFWKRTIEWAKTGVLLPFMVICGLYVNAMLFVRYCCVLCANLLLQMQEMID